MNGGRGGYVEIPVASTSVQSCFPPLLASPEEKSAGTSYSQYNYPLVLVIKRKGGCGDEHAVMCSYRGQENSVSLCTRNSVFHVCCLINHIL